MSGQCDNCGERLSGEYCFACGQPRKSPIMSIGELLGEYFRDVFSLDSRAWRTLASLLLHPGAMTADYLGGRRYAYTPPVRLYLLSSLLFLAILTFPLLLDSWRQNFEVSVSPAAPESAPATSDEAPPEQAAVAPPDAATEEPSEEDECVDLDIDLEGIDSPWWREFITQRAERACRLFTLEGGPQGFAEEFLDGLPVMLLGILPLMACVLAALYPFSGRRYVEHLILLAHYHSFVFLLVGLTVVLAGIPLWGLIRGLMIAYTSFYTPWYLYRSMRTVYGQGRGVTAVKFMLLTAAYLFGLSLALAIGLLLAAESFTR